MDKQRLDAIRARCEAATPGEWVVIHKGNALSVIAKSGAFTLNICHYSHKDGADAEFIAHARTDVPDLLAEIERLTAELAAMTAERDEAQLELTRMTEAYDVNARALDALNRDYVALRKRAEAAERDMAFACGSQPSASSDCSICDICAHKRDDGSCAKQCFMNAMAAMNRWEWRGPEEEKE
jgi:hypothetical protein